MGGGGLPTRTQPAVVPQALPPSDLGLGFPEGRPSATQADLARAPASGLHGEPQASQDKLSWTVFCFLAFRPLGLSLLTCK